MSQPPAELTRSTPSTVVDAEVLAHGRLTWEGRFNHTRFARLHEVALSDSPEVVVQLAFAIVDQRPVVEGRLTTEFELVCQRCMGSMRHPVSEQFALMLVSSDDELDQVPESYEPWVSNPQRLNVFDLIEEQLLLALPLIAKHVDEQECVQVAPGLLTVSPVHAAAQSQQVNQGEPTQKPFGNLRELLRK